MIEKNKIDPIEELLRILYLESSVDPELSKVEEPLYQLKKLPAGTQMAEHKKQLLFEKLLPQMAEAPSFGQLLLDYIRKEGFTAESLSGRVKLSVERINAITEDEMITNLIPVVLLKNLLNTLHISLEEARQAIWKTYEILQQKKSEGRGDESLQVSFRRSYPPAGGQKGSGVRGENDEKNLYLNKEALGRYLNRLEELMKKE